MANWRHQLRLWFQENHWPFTEQEFPTTQEYLANEPMLIQFYTNICLNYRAQMNVFEMGDVGNYLDLIRDYLAQLQENMIDPQTVNDIVVNFPHFELVLHHLTDLWNQFRQMTQIMAPTLSRIVNEVIPIQRDAITTRNRFNDIIGLLETAQELVNPHPGHHHFWQ